MTVPATICFPFVGDTVGGSHLSALLLAGHLAPGRWRPMVVVHEEGPLTAHLERVGVDYSLFPLPCYVGRQSGIARQAIAMARTVAPLVRFLRRHSVALVHTNDGRMHLTWTLPARLAGVGTVWHQRTAFPASRLAALMLRLAGTIVCISRYVAGTLAPRVAGGASVISNPVEPYRGTFDRSAFRSEIRRAAGAPDETRIVGTVGNLRHVKRPMVFVEAAIRIQEASDEPLVFAVFGDDREGHAPRMRARAREANPAPHLAFLGFRYPVEPWIAACDLLLAPSAGDGFGRAPIEAMLAGTPVVAADAGGHPEIIEDGTTGVLVPKDDPGAMADAAIEMLRNRPLADRIRRFARKDAARYGAAAHARAMEAHYDGLLGR